MDLGIPAQVSFLITISLLLSADYTCSMMHRCLCLMMNSDRTSHPVHEFNALPSFYVSNVALFLGKKTFLNPHDDSS